MADKVKKLLPMSEAMADCLGVFAQERNRSMLEVMTTAIAEYIGYDIELERRNKTSRAGRPAKYKSAEERKLASRNRAAKRRELVRMVLSDAAKQQREYDVANIEASLARRKIID